MHIKTHENISTPLISSKKMTENVKDIVNTGKKNTMQYQILLTESRGKIVCRGRNIFFISFYIEEMFFIYKITSSPYHPFIPYLTYHRP